MHHPSLMREFTHTNARYTLNHKTKGEIYYLVNKFFIIQAMQTKFIQYTLLISSLLHVVYNHNLPQLTFSRITFKDKNGVLISTV